MKTIKFKDLSISLKIAIVLAWITGISYILAFILGFMGYV